MSFSENPQLHRIVKRRVAGFICGAALLAGASLASMTRGSAETAVAVPPPAIDEPAAKDAKLETAVLAGGCFWGVQGVFQHVKGVQQAVSGYAGGAQNTASYEQVSTGRTGHAESVKVTFDPHIVSYGTILQVYFSVAHNPTQLNRQGPDTGPQYRSVIFAENDAQKHVAEAYIAQLDKAGVFARPIVTEVNLAKGFYAAEAYHQDYLTLHPDSSYIAFNDLPKIDNLRRLFPNLYGPDAKLVSAGTVSN